MKKRNVVIFDLDGTLSNCDHRKQYIESTPKNWDMFYSLCGGDDVIESAATLFNLLKESGHYIVILTGRRDSERGATMKWLKTHELFPHEIRMRPSRSFIPDTKLKQGWLDDHYNKDEILMWFEDRKSVVEMVRSNGIICHQVAEGNF